MKPAYAKRVSTYTSCAIILILLGVLFSCAKYIDDPAPVDTTTRWLGYLQNGNDTIVVKNGYVYLSTHNGISANGTSITSYNKLKGDFEVKISYSSFIALGQHSFSDQLIFKFLNSNQEAVITSYLTNQDIYLQDSTRTGLSKSTINREGQFYVKRVGSTVYSWMLAGTDSLMMNKTNYSTDDLSIEMEVYAADNTAINTSVHLDNIVVNGGGGFIKSNTFDESTIQITE